MASVEHSFNSRTPANLIPGATWDEVHHLANITGISGILRMMGKPFEKTLARGCREAGARVAENVLLQNVNLQGISSVVPMKRVRSRWRMALLSTEGVRRDWAG